MYNTLYRKSVKGTNGRSGSFITAEQVSEGGMSRGAHHQILSKFESMVGDECFNQSQGPMTKRNKMKKQRTTTTKVNN